LQVFHTTFELLNKTSLPVNDFASDNKSPHHDTYAKSKEDRCKRRNMIAKAGIHAVNAL
jgi:hypothetical protein